MRFTKTIDLSTITEIQLAQLQPGQWVTQGPRQPALKGADLGRFYGVRKSGVVVVAWMGNARGHRRSPEGIRGYLSFMRSYAR